MHSIRSALTLLCGLFMLPITAQLLATTVDILLKLDYATYRGQYQPQNEVYVFRNIRYAAPPVGALRWAKPAPPLELPGIQDQKEAIACTQPPAQDVRTVAGAVVGAGQEDCLFLDLTIPRKVFENPETKVPVLIWVHGGYYTQGSKDERSFHQFAKLSNGNLISVAANYRIGAYGFLGGSTVEREGTPNAGLWDQRAAFEWVQKYIGQIGGNKDQVTAMGISAGAGSILHHMTAEGGQRDPLFQRAILQSAGYATIQDRTGDVERKFKGIEEFAGCKDRGLACLRALDEPTMRRVSEFANSGNRQGSSGWDPVVDGKLIQDTPVLEIKKGRYWKAMQSLISGYAFNEAGGRWFVDQSINSSAKFDEYVRSGFGSHTSPNFEGILRQLQQLYPSTESPGTPFRTTSERVAAYVADVGFNCHHRAIAEAYPNKTFTYQSSLFGGTHYMDQFISFVDTNGLYALLYGGGRDAAASQAFMTYLVSEMVAGNPNALRNKLTTIEWPLTAGYTDTALTGILDVKTPMGPAGFSVITSPRLVKEKCAFWDNVWVEMGKVVGSLVI